MTDEPSLESVEQVPSEQPTMTPDQAKVEMDRLMGNPQFSQQWMNKGLGHDYAVHRVRELGRIAHGRTDSPTGGNPVAGGTVSHGSNEEEFTQNDYLTAGLALQEVVGMPAEEVEGLTTTLNEVAVASQLPPNEMKILAGQIETSINRASRNGNPHDTEATANKTMGSLRGEWGENFDANLAIFHESLNALGKHRDFIGNAILQAGPATATWAIKRLVSRRLRYAAP